MFKLHICQRILFALPMVLIAWLQEPHAAETGSPLLNTFKSHYDQLLQQVEQGRHPVDTGKQAEELWLSLRQDLVYLDARVQAYKLEIGETNGARQQKAMQNLIEVSAERERLLINAIQNLDSLVQGKTIDIPISTGKSQMTPPNRSETKDQGSGSVTISIEPEDLTAPAWD